MAVLTANFETGVDGNTISTGDVGDATAWDVVQISAGGTITYSDDHYYASPGTLSGRVAAGGASSGCHFGWSTALGTVTDYYGQIYFWHPTLGGGGTSRQIHTTSGGNNAISIRLKSDGKIELIDSGNTVRATSTGSITGDSWNRIAFHFIHSTTVGQIEAKLYSPAWSVSPETVTTAANLNTRANADTILFGQTAASPAGSPTLFFDNITANDTNYPAAALPDPLVITDADFGFGTPANGQMPYVTYDVPNDEARIWFRANGDWYYVVGQLP